jgi:hypothetical protein
MRVLEEINAKVIIIECARHFMSHDGGRDARHLFERLLLAGNRALNAVWQSLLS